jgi:hypothetical protein
VYVALAYAPLVVRYEGEGLLDHCGRPFLPVEALEDDEGSVLFAGEGTVALLDDRDLARFAEEMPARRRLARAEIGLRFGFIADPRPG